VPGDAQRLRQVVTNLLGNKRTFETEVPTRKALEPGVCQTTAGSPKAMARLSAGLC
jgi:hypothetical protein